MASTWMGWLGEKVGNFWMTYDDANYPACFEYASTCGSPCCSFAIPLEADHPILSKIHGDLVPRIYQSHPWLVCHLLKCSGCTMRIGKEDEVKATDNGDHTAKDYWLLQCFVPVEHTSDQLPWPAQGITYVGIFYEQAITRDSADALLYCRRVPMLESGLEVNVQEGMDGASYTVRTPSGINFVLAVKFNPLDLDIARLAEGNPGAQTPVVEDASFFLTYRNVYYKNPQDGKLFVGSMGESTGGALNATAECTGELLGCEVGCDLQCHVFTSKYLRTQIIAEWFSQALAEETYVPRALGGTDEGMMRASMDICQPGEEMTALEKHVLFFCGDPEHAPHISTATLSFEEMINRISLLRGFEHGSMATALGYVVLGSFGLKVRSACPMMRKFYAEEGWSIPNIGMEGVARLGLHGSHSGIYNQYGQFDENKFQEMLRITGAATTGVITEQGIIAMQALHYESWFSHQQAAGEMSALFSVGFDGTAPNRTIDVQRMRKFYDGTLLYESVGETPPWL